VFASDKISYRLITFLRSDENEQVAGTTKKNPEKGKKKEHGSAHIAPKIPRDKNRSLHRQGGIALRNTKTKKHQGILMFFCRKITVQKIINASSTAELYVLF
jgi:hypothetical protein